MLHLFPAHDDKRKYDTEKGGLKEYMIEWAKAISGDVNNGNYKIFAGNSQRYTLQRLYAMNKQPIEKYQRMANASDQVSQEMMNADFTPTGPLPKFIKIAIEKILLSEYGPVCTPIDMLSRNESLIKLARLKSKLMVKQMMQRVDPEEANNPMMSAEPGEPQDIEEMEMRIAFGDQFNRAMDAELTISAAFHETDTWNRRPDWVKDLVFHGLAMFKDYLNENGRPAWRKVNLKNFVCNRVDSERFEDMRWAGELIKVSHAELKSHFTEQEMETIINQSSIPNPFNNIGITYPANNIQDRQDRDKGQSLVFDFEFLTNDCLTVEHGTSTYGNLQVKKMWGKKKEKSNRISKGIEMVYGAKWIVGTNLIYNYGPVENMLRNYANPAKMQRTQLNYWGIADDMTDMIVASYMDRLMPLADDYMMARINIQNIRNEMIPNGWAINEDALEDSDLTLNGTDMTKEAKIKLFVKRGILVYRGKGLDGSQNGNAKPIEFLQNNVFGEFLRLYDQLQIIKQEMRDVLGLNEVTDGSTPSDRMLNGVASMAEQSTSTALRPLMRCDKYILEKLSKRMLIRVQQAIRKNGKYAGYAPSLNGSTLRYIEADDKITEKDYDIMIEVRPNDEQKQMLIAQMQGSIEQGLIDPTEIFTILTTYNLKQAQEMLAYKVEKRRQQKHKEAMELQQMNGQIQQESAMAAEQAKQQTMEKEYELRLIELKEKYDREKELLQMKLDSNERTRGRTDNARIVETSMKQEQEQAVPDLMAE